MRCYDEIAFGAFAASIWANLAVNIALSRKLAKAGVRFNLLLSNPLYLRDVYRRYCRESRTEPNRALLHAHLILLWSLPLVILAFGAVSNFWR